ncbi:IS66 family insertion sequence element accessory protein TnpB [Caballeronia choica]|uniref:IS66 family insertion sequence element accessory protein TnpB n=1 Tax=Caballeronia choica TaxID=326476 RepID=UPI0035B4FEB3
MVNENPLSGNVYIFRGGRGELVKILWATEDGIWLLAKRLERGRFIWPQADSGELHRVVRRSFRFGDLEFRASKVVPTT